MGAVEGDTRSLAIVHQGEWKIETTILSGFRI